MKKIVISIIVIIMCFCVNNICFAETKTYESSNGEIKIKLEDEGVRDLIAETTSENSTLELDDAEKILGEIEQYGLEMYLTGNFRTGNDFRNF